MDKAPDAYRTISEVAEDLDLPQHVLRFWETRFGQIKPLKRGGGRRYYRPDDVELLKGIRHLLYKEGYTIKGVQRILKEQGPRAVQAVARPAEASEWDIAAVESAAPQPAAPVLAAAPLPPPLRPAGSLPPVGPAAPDVPAAFTRPIPVEPRSGFSEARAYPVMPPLTPPPAFEPYLTSAPADVPVESADVVPPAADSEPHFLPLEDIPLPESGAATPARGQVSMFRGGLQRGEAGPATGAMADFANDLRDRVELALERHEPVALPMPTETDPVRPVATRLPGLVSAAPPQEHLVRAFEDLVACRAVIDRVLARRAARS